MRIILDSTELVADMRLRSAAFRIFCEGTSKSGAEVYVPEVVITEVCGKYQQDVTKLQAESESTAKALKRLTDTDYLPILTKAEIKTAAGQYRRYLEDEIKKHRFRILPISSIPHASLVDRAVAKRKPFNERGAGYRDALIWDAVLTLARTSDSKIIFITNNSSDFGGRDRLANDLVEDLKSQSCASDQVRVLESFDAFNQAYIIPPLGHEANLAKRLETDSLPGFSVYSWGADCLLEFLRANKLDRILQVAVPSGIDYSIEDIEGINSFDVDDVRTLPGGDHLVFLSADVAMTISVSAGRERYLSDEKVRDYIGWITESFESYTDTRIGSVKIGISFVLGKDDYSLKAAQPNYLEGTYGRVDLNEHPTSAI